MKSWTKVKSFVIIVLILMAILVALLNPSDASSVEINVSGDILTLEWEKYIEDNKYYYNELIPLDEEIQQFTYELAKQYDIEVELIFAVMKCESDFNQSCKSYNSKINYDIGIMQINSRNIKKGWVTSLLGREVDVENNIYDNIEGGVAILNHYLHAWDGCGYSDDRVLRMGLNSYNFGVAGYKRYMNRGNNWNSWYYAKKILKAKESLTEIEFNDIMIIEEVEIPIS